MRLQRIMLQLQRYDLSLVYRKGSQSFIADTLSRAQLSESLPADIYEDYEVLTVQPVASHKMAELQRETVLDPVMVSLSSVILHGWSESENDVPEDLKPFFNVRDQLATRDGVIYKGVIWCYMKKSWYPSHFILIIYTVSIWVILVSSQPRKELVIFYIGPE